jgi:hypothetical protein
MFSNRRVHVQAGGSNSRPRGVLTKWLASRVIYSESRQASLHANECG